EGDSGEPWSRFAVLFHLVGADHARGNLAVLTLIEVLRIGAEVLAEFLSGDRFVEVTEVDLGEVVALAVLEVARHVDAVEEVVHVVDAGDLFRAEEVAQARLEDERLFPGRAGLEALARLREGEAQPYGDEVLPLDDLRLQLARLGADLRTFH